MKYLVAIGLMLAGSGLSAEEPSAAPTAGPEQVQELIEKLGARQFTDRQAAMVRIQELGLVTLPALQVAAQSENHEIRVRAEFLLRHVRRADMLRKLAQFEQNPNSPIRREIPGWEPYSAAIGDTPATRELFVKMLRQEYELFQLWAARDQNFTGEFETRSYQLQNLINGFRRDEKIGSAAALLFLASDPQLDSSVVALSVAYGMTYQNDIKELLEETDDRQQEARVAMRRILGHWLQAKSLGPQAWYQKSMVAMRYNHPAGMVPARRLLQSGAVGTQLQYGLLAVARLGDTSDLPLLAPFLKNTQVLASGTQSVTRNGSTTTLKYTTEIRDVALTCTLRLYGLNASQIKSRFGFPDLQENELYVFQLNSARFYSAAQRETAFRTWETFRQEHRLPLPAPRP